MFVSESETPELVGLQVFRDEVQIDFALGDSRQNLFSEERLKVIGFYRRTECDRV